MNEETRQQEDIPFYEQQVKEGVSDPRPYDRLMIAYRKEKNYQQELRIVKRGLAVFEKLLKERQYMVLKGNRNRSRILELSRTIGKQTGLVNKKGEELHVPEPLARWQKRRATIELKIKKASQKKKSARRK